MPRQKSYDRDELLAAAMNTFWTCGYEATSMDDLVKSTGVSRHGIYTDIGGKHALYLESFKAYQARIVTPALEALETDRAGLGDIAAYFETQIALANRMGLPGPGCLVANAMTETAPHDEKVATFVAAHNGRLTAAFLNALEATDSDLTAAELKALARFLTVTAQGLWSMSRTVRSARPLRNCVKTLLDLIEGKLRI